ncbi:MAG TPA: T9SS type A sorting domain-containing protein, partial [Candidatus Kapabacteria bacterium]|nr:T9SS type A sorting domain-containing protein [Candidatus Kapabacteria bacterium]
LIPSMNNTGKNSTLVISIENNDGNEIGIYNMNDELIGAGAVCNGLAAITIWGDDDYTQGVDGANENEYLHAKLFKTKNNTMTNIPLLNIRELTNNTEQNALFYETNTIYFAKSVSIDESVFGMSIKNIPNPVENDVVFEFGLTEESNAEIQIYTSTGELVASIGNKVYSAGIHRIEFDAGNLTSGVYNIVLSSGSNKVSSFMIVDK